MAKQGKKMTRREKPEFDQKLLNLARVTRVVKGGRRFRFRATLVIGNRKGKVGVGVAKGSDVSDAIKKAYNDAKKNMITVQLAGGTLSHDVAAKLGSARVLLKPASLGRGIIAGGAVRAVVDLLGVKDIVSKSLGASNSLNVARVTIKALQMLKAPRAPKAPKETAETAKEEAVVIA
jgi:small subunit ribosomal protein S5